MEALGSAPVFSLRRVERPTFRVEFEYDGFESFWSEGDGENRIPRRKAQKRTFFSEAAAYRWLARRMVFVRRDKLCTGPIPEEGGYPSCTWCQPRGSDDSGHIHGLCRYHDSDSFRRLTDRVARWLRWRDSKRAA